MRTRTASLALALAPFWLALSTVARADQAPLPPPTESQPVAVIHTPIASAPADQPLVVHAEVRNAHRLAEVALHYHHRGDPLWRRVPFARDVDGGFVTIVPASDTAPGTLDYFIATYAPDGAERLAFASPQAPHPVALLGDNEARWKRELLAQHLGNHSRFQLTGEAVDFGARRDGAGVELRDYYWNAQLDYTYRILAWMYSIRLGVGILGGETYGPVAGELKIAPTDAVGLKYGFAEARVRAGAWVRLDFKVTLGAGPHHFDGGGGGQVLIGRDPGTHFAVGTEYISSVGLRAWLRLAWATVPRVPMSLTLEVTTWPTQDAVAGRAWFSAGYRLSRHFSVDARIGYATRDWGIGGVMGGAGTTLEF